MLTKNLIGSLCLRLRLLSLEVTTPFPHNCLEPIYARHSSEPSALIQARLGIIRLTECLGRARGRFHPASTHRSIRAVARQHPGKHSPSDTERHFFLMFLRYREDLSLSLWLRVARGFTFQLDHPSDTSLFKQHPIVTIPAIFVI
jgi:hypothetical protein